MSTQWIGIEPSRLEEALSDIRLHPTDRHGFATGAVVHYATLELARAARKSLSDDFCAEIWKSTYGYYSLSIHAAGGRIALIDLDDEYRETRV